MKKLFLILAIIFLLVVNPSLLSAKEKVWRQVAPEVKCADIDSDIVECEIVHKRKTDLNMNEELNVISSYSSSCYSFLIPGGSIKWKGFSLPLTYYINPTNSYGLSESFIKNTMIASSVDTWDKYLMNTNLVGGANINYSLYYGYKDNKNTIAFGNYPTAGVIAVTIVWYNTTDQKITEFDMEFDTDWVWGNASADSSKMDLQNIATHEFGHAFGLADMYDSACSDVTMYGYSGYGDMKQRTLEIPDITGIKALYNDTSPIDTTPPSVAIQLPLNIIYGVNLMGFSVLATDSSGVSSCEYSLNNGVTNYSMSNSSANYTIGLGNWNGAGYVSAGNQTVRYYCRDSFGNLNNSETRTFFVDLSPPTTPIVSDYGVYTLKNNSLYASWISQDNESGVYEYQYQITDGNGTIVKSWTSTGANNYVNATGLNLQSGKTYYFNVKARNLVNLWSGVGVSDGIIFYRDIKISGNGYNYPVPFFRASLSVDVNASSLTGWFKYYYTRNRMSFASTSINSVSVNGNSAIVSGVGLLNNIPNYTFSSTIVNGNPDLTSVTIYNPSGGMFYSSSLKNVSSGDYNVEYAV